MRVTGSRFRRPESGPFRVFTETILVSFDGGGRGECIGAIPVRIRFDPAEISVCESGENVKIGL